MSASSQSAQSASNRLAEQASPTTQPQTSATTFSTISTQPQSVANAAQPSPTLTAGQQASLSPRYPTGPGTPNPVPTAGGAVTTSNPFGTGVPTFTANYLPGTGVGIESYQVPQSDQSGYILQGPGIAETELSSEVVISAFTTYVTFTVLLTSVYTSFPREYCSVVSALENLGSPVLTDSSYYRPLPRAEGTVV